MKRTTPLPKKRATPRRKGPPTPRIRKPDANFRCQKMRDLAKEVEECMCCQTPNDGTIIGAHPNGLEYGKGSGLKANDLVAYMCMTCHDLYDGRAKGWDGLQAKQAWHMAFYRSMVWLAKSGHMEVK